MKRAHLSGGNSQSLPILNNANSQHSDQIRHLSIIFESKLRGMKH